MDNEFRTARGYEQKLNDGKLLTASMEDYVEMLYRCYIDGEQKIRLNKLAELLNVRDSSASKMMQKLGVLGLIDYEKYGLIKLTELGMGIGRVLLDRHNTVEKFLKFISCNKDVFLETELIEHIINSDTVKYLKKFNDFIEENPNIPLEYEEFIKRLEE